MNALTRFESFMQELMDRRVVRMLGGGLQPIEVAHALARCLDEHAARGEAAPSLFRVLVNPHDAADLRGLDAQIERSLDAYAVEAARERDMNFLQPPRTLLLADENMQPGEVQVEAESAAPARRPAPARRRPLMVAEHRHFSELPALPDLTLELPGADGLTTVPIDHLPFSIGRRAGNDLVLPDPRVSREHAVIEEAGGGIRLRDLGSHNGTEVNGQPVMEADLHDGDCVVIGGWQVTLRLRQSTAHGPGT